MAEGGLAWDPSTTIDINCITSPCGWCWEGKRDRFIEPPHHSSVSIRYTPEKEYGLWSKNIIPKGTVLEEMDANEYRQWAISNKNRPFACWSYPRLPKAPVADKTTALAHLLRGKAIREGLQAWHKNAYLSNKLKPQASFSKKR